MSLRLSGLNPLAYMGVEPTQPPQLVIYDFVPTVNDYRNFNLGTLWLVYPSNAQTIWMLISVADFQATWVQIWPGGGGGGATQFPTNSGTAIEVGGVLNILGDGVAITTSGAGNTVTITAMGDVGTTYRTNAGDAAPSAGILKIFGGTNINTSGTSNVVTVNLDDSITLAGNLVVDGFAIIDTALGLTFATDGVLQVDGSGVVSATNGTNGQVLIGGGTAPVWANLTSTGGTVTITNGPNTINLESAGGGGVGSPIAFSAYQASNVNAPSNPVVADPTVYEMGTLSVLSIITNTGGGFYPGDGAGTPASFTAPAAGTYYFEFRIQVAGATSPSITYLHGNTNYARIQTPSYLFSSTDLFQATGPNTSTDEVYYTSCTVPLTLGQQVTFDFLGPSSGSGGGATAFIVQGSYVFPMGGPLNYVTTISGFLVTAISAPSPAGTVGFSAYQNTDILVPSGPTMPTGFVSYQLGTQAALITSFNEGAAFYPGDGAGSPAVFTAPVAGNYFFDLTIYVTSIPSSTYPGANPLQSGYAQIITPAQNFAFQNLSFRSATVLDSAMINVTAFVHLDVNDQVLFATYNNANTNPNSPSYRVNGLIRSPASAFTNDVATQVSGYLV